LTSGVSRLRCSVAKIKSIRQQRPQKKFKIPGSVVQWGIVGIVAVALMLLVVQALSRPPAEPPPAPLLAHAENDLISLTRMLGDVTLDSTTRSLLGAAMAFCHFEADNPDRSLQYFRKSLAAGPAAGIASRIEFSMGWMFQSRGYQDSAIAYYSRVRANLPDSVRLLRAYAANNAGAAYEVLEDTAAAGEALRDAAALLDTVAYPKEARLVQENLSRLTGRR
jgi:tetratricopeptide (TPR) repeat protein